MWHVKRNGDTVVFTNNQFKQQLAKGFIQSTDMCWTKGMSKFKPAHSIRLISRYVKPAEETLDFTKKDIYELAWFGYAGVPWFKMNKPLIAIIYIFSLLALGIIEFFIIYNFNRDLKMSLLFTVYSTWATMVPLSIICLLHVYATINNMNEYELAEYVKEYSDCEDGPVLKGLDEYEEDNSIEDVFGKIAEQKRQEEERRMELENQMSDIEYRKLEKQNRIEERRNAQKELKAANEKYKQVIAELQQRVHNGDTDAARLLKKQLKQQDEMLAHLWSIDNGVWDR